MDEQQLEAMLNSGDPELIEQAIALYEGSQDVVDASSSAGKPGNDNATAAVADVDLADAGSNTDPVGVASKNNQHIIPFEVLEQERQQNALLRQQLEERDRQIAEANNLAAGYQATTEKLQLLQAQLEKNGITPAELPHEMQLTAEELEGLGEYGDIGDVARKLGHKLMATTALVEKLQQQLASPAAAKQPEEAPAETPASIVQKAIDQVEGLRAVMADPVLSPKAVQLDQQLQNDAAWANKPMAERFAEVMRRMAPTVIANERNRKDPNHKETADDLAPPYSLSGIPGATSDVIVPLAQQFEGMTEAQVQERMNSLSDADQQRLLASLGF